MPIHPDGLHGRGGPSQRVGVRNPGQVPKKAFANFQNRGGGKFSPPPSPQPNSAIQDALVKRRI